MRYSQHFQTKETPQSEAIPGTNQVQNNAGGFAWAVDDWTRLARFLILGSEGGTFYVGEKELTVRNAKTVAKCLKADGLRVVEMAVNVSVEGRAPSNDPALFVLAMASSPNFAGPKTRAAALAALPRVARIGTHLFHYAADVDAMRGWGRGLRDAVGEWYRGKDADRLAYQAVKYQQRDGWSHRDLLRKAHPTPPTVAHDDLFHWITQGMDDKRAEHLPELVLAFEAAKNCKTAKEIIPLIEKYGLTREMVPTELLNDRAVWAALLMKMPMTAMIRNLGKMTSIGLLEPMSTASGLVVGKLGDGEYIRKSRVHPLAVLVAMKTYAQGRGFRGSLTWSPIGQVVDALDGAFYEAFGNVEPTGKNIMLALDVSGSMNIPMSNSVVTCREASSAMALITARTEQNYMMTGFYHGITELPITPRQRLDDVVRYTSGLPFGGTDCALPMLYAKKKSMEIDAFVIYTDSETRAGRIHPSQALNEYRNKTGRPAKLVVVGMVSNGFSIADPNDSGMLDVVGFDTAAPNVISDFIG